MTQGLSRPIPLVSTPALMGSFLPSLHPQPRDIGPWAWPLPLKSLHPWLIVIPSLQQPLPLFETPHGLGEFPSLPNGRHEPMILFAVRGMVVHVRVEEAGPVGRQTISFERCRYSLTSLRRNSQSLPRDGRLLVANSVTGRSLPSTPHGLIGRWS